MAIENPFYPGYYPGDPIIKGPPGGGSLIQPSEFNMDVIEEEINELDVMLPNIPEWTKDQILEDIKFQMRATFYGDIKSTVAYETAAETDRYAEEERQDLPGAIGIVLDLDPGKWKDPGKMLKKTAVNWGKAIFDYDDLDARVKRELWKDLLREDSTRWKEKGATATTAKNIRHQGRTIAGGVQLATSNPLKLTGVLPGTDKKLRKLEDDAITSILNFQSQYRSVFAREETYDDVLESSLKLISKDIELQMGTTTTGIPLEAGRLGRSFMARADLAGTLGSVDKAVGRVETALNRTLMETAGSKKAGLTPLQDLNQELKKLSDEVKNTRDKIAGLRTNTNINRQELARIDHIITPFDKRLADMESLITQGTGTNAVSRTHFLNRLSALRNSTVGHRGIKSGTTLTPGFRSQYLRSFEPELIGRGKLGKEGSLLQNTFGRNGRGVVPKIRTIVARTQIDKEREMYRELFANLEGDNLSRNYIWPKIRSMLVGYTPAYYVEHFLKRSSYFGLVIKDDIIGATPKNPFYRAMNSIIRDNKAFHNRFKINFTDGFGNSITRLFNGGTHFAAVEELVKLDPATLGELLQLTDIADIISKLNALGIDKPEEFAEKLMEFKKWLTDFQHRINKDLTRDTQGLKNLLVALAKYNDNPDLNGIGITTKYIGLLQRIGNRLSKLQTEIVNTALGKIAKKLLSWKTALVESLSAAISTALPVLAPFERIVAAILRKVVDITENLAKKIVNAIFKGGIEDINEFLDDAGKAIAKTAMYATILISIPALFVLLALGAILTTIPQDNPGKAIGDGGDICVTEGNCGGGGGTIGGGGNGYTNDPADPLENPQACPINNPSLTCPSYPICHGTAGYWGNNRTCYNIPGYINNGTDTADHPTPDGVCDWAIPKQPWYGYAADFINTNRQNDPYVYAPDYGDGGSWTVSYISTSACCGSAIILVKPGDILAIMHVDVYTGIGSGTTLEPGDYIGRVSDFPDYYDDNGVPHYGTIQGDHIHLEMFHDGQVVRPEDYLCRGS